MLRRDVDLDDVQETLLLRLREALAAFLAFSVSVWPQPYAQPPSLRDDRDGQAEFGDEFAHTSL
jgi:hypothetical protein